MKDEERYNGWKNYETWLVALWIDNDKGLQEMAREIAKGKGKNYEKAMALKELIEDMNPLNEGSGLFVDLMTAALGNVNWKEVLDERK
jgi:hypothetical protein